MSGIANNRKQKFRLKDSEKFQVVRLVGDMPEQEFSSWSQAADWVTEKTGIPVSGKNLEHLHRSAGLNIRVSNGHCLRDGRSVAKDLQNRMTTLEKQVAELLEFNKSLGG